MTDDRKTLTSGTRIRAKARVEYGQQGPTVHAGTLGYLVFVPPPMAYKDGGELRAEWDPFPLVTFPIAREAFDVVDDPTLGTVARRTLEARTRGHLRAMPDPDDADALADPTTVAMLRQAAWDGFAAHALGGMLACDDEWKEEPVAQRAARIADLMLSERAKRQGGAS